MAILTPCFSLPLLMLGSQPGMLFASLLLANPSLIHPSPPPEGPPPHSPGLDWALHLWLTEHTAAAPVILRWHPASSHAAKLCALPERGLCSLFLCPCCSAWSPEYSKFSVPICVEWLKKQNGINKWVVRMFSVIFLSVILPFCSGSEIHLHFVYT